MNEMLLFATYNAIGILRHTEMSAIRDVQAKYDEAREVICITSQGSLRLLATEWIKSNEWTVPVRNMSHVEDYFVQYNEEVCHLRMSQLTT